VQYREAKLAAAWRFAEAALMRFELGASARGLELAQEAFSLAEPHLGPSPSYEQLILEMRRSRQGEAGGV